MKTALISVYNKEGIVQFVQELVALGWNILASGGTARVLREAGISVRDVAELVGGGAILGHRVVTLSREIHAGLLARPIEDAEEMAHLGIPYIDLVCVDLYPLQAEIAKPDATLESVIEQTDIGGPTLLRSAAKGRRIVISDPGAREGVLRWLKAGQPEHDTFIRALAARAEYVVSKYCLASAHYQNPQYDGMIGQTVQTCCYGENRWQAPASLYSTLDRNDPLALEHFQLIAGSQPSFINERDIDRLLQTITHIETAFSRNYNWTHSRPIAVACKHGNPCGAAVGLGQMAVIQRMALGDPISLFGGLVMTNFTIGVLEAVEMLTAGMKGKQRALDGVVAPLIMEEAKQRLLRKNDRCRLYQNGALNNLRDSLNTEPLRVPVRGGYLLQPNYTYVLDLKDPQLEKSGEVDKQMEADLLLAWAVGSTSNSNTVTLVKDGMLIGNGVGQQDRVGCCELALARAQRSKHDVRGAVAYSDSFFPFPDGPKLLAEAGIKAILTSSGSQNDNKTRAVCAEHGIALWMIPDAVGRGFFGH